MWELVLKKAYKSAFVFLTFMYKFLKPHFFSYFFFFLLFKVKLYFNIFSSKNWIINRNISKYGYNRNISKLINLIFRNRTIFWNISKWNKGQTKWNGGSNCLSYWDIYNIRVDGNEYEYEYCLNSLLSYLTLMRNLRSHVRNIVRISLSSKFLFFNFYV